MKVASVAERLQKIANEYTVQPGYLDAQQGMQRAVRAGDAGISQFLADSELIGDRMKGGLGGAAIGGLGGAALGGLGGALLGGAEGATLGAATGGALGAMGGSTVGEIKAQTDFLRRKGIDPILLGLGGARFTPEAAERYGVKSASIAEYSVLFDTVAEGELGEGARQALYGVCQAIEAPIAAEKSASVYDASNLSEEDARKARLDQLLKR